MFPFTDWRPFVASEYAMNHHVSKPETYRLRIRKLTAGELEGTWHVTDTNPPQPGDIPKIPGSDRGYIKDYHAGPAEEVHHHEVQEQRDPKSPPLAPLAPLPLEAKSQQQSQSPSWKRVYQCLFNWVQIWSERELQRALASTQTGSPVDEIALTIWMTQLYKRYVRWRHAEQPPGRVDCLCVPPNIADAISIAVFDERHDDAKTMLRDLRASFGLEGPPRLLIVLARHQRDSAHYVVHRYVGLTNGNGLILTSGCVASHCLKDL
jgi:hypothetical protein